MPHIPPGARVVALRSSTTDLVSLYGRGVYLGTRLLPSRTALFDDDPGNHWIRDLIASAEATVAKPRVEFTPRGTPTGIDNYGFPLNEPLTVDTVMTSYLTGILGSACIDLRDENDHTVGHVYGEQCWWATEDAYAARFGDLPTTTVPLPHGQDGPAPAEDAIASVMADLRARVA